MRALGASEDLTDCIPDSKAGCHRCLCTVMRGAAPYLCGDAWLYASQAAHGRSEHATYPYSANLVTKSQKVVLNIAGQPYRTAE